MLSPGIHSDFLSTVFLLLPFQVHLVGPLRTSGANLCDAQKSVWFPKKQNKRGSNWRQDFAVPSQNRITWCPKDSAGQDSGTFFPVSALTSSDRVLNPQKESL
jgi:hypothetical protein